MIYTEGALVLAEQKLQVNLKKKTHKAMANKIFTKCTRILLFIKTQPEVFI